MHFWCVRRHPSESVINKEYSVCKTIGEYRHYLYQSRGACTTLIPVWQRAWWILRQVLINKCSVVIFRNVLTSSHSMAQSQLTNGYKATKFDDYEDCGATLWNRLKILTGYCTVYCIVQLKLQQWGGLTWVLSPVCQCHYVIFSLKMFDCL